MNLTFGQKVYITFLGILIVFAVIGFIIPDKQTEINAHTESLYKPEKITSYQLTPNGISQAGYPILWVNDTQGNWRSKLELIYNTPFCSGINYDCYAIINITLFENSTLPTLFNFVELTEGRLKTFSYNVYTSSKVDVIKPAYTCNPYMIGTDNYPNCTQIGNITVIEDDWKKYNGEVKPVGTYLVKMESKMDEPFISVDWAFSFQNVTSTEIRNYWATFNYTYRHWIGSNETTNGSDSNSRGAEITPNMNITLDSIELFPSDTASSCTLKYNNGTLITTKTPSARIAIFNVNLTQGKVYWVQCSGGTMAYNSVRLSVNYTMLNFTNQIYNDAVQSNAYTRTVWYVTATNWTTSSISLDITQDTSNALNITDVTPDLKCNFSSVGQNISSVLINVHGVDDSLDYTNTDTGSAGTMSYNKTWTTTTLADDTYKWSCKGFGSEGINATTTNRTFTLDASVPTFVSVTNITSISSRSLPVSSHWYANISDAHIGACQFQTSDNSTNITIPCFTDETTRVQINWTTYGVKWVNIWANDTFGNIINQSYPLSISNISVTANAPAVLYRSANPSVTFNCSAEYNPAAASANLSLYIDTVINYTLTETCGGSCDGLSIELSRTLSEGDHTWYCQAENNINGDVALTTSRDITIDYTDPVVVAYNITNISGKDVPSSVWWVSINDTNRDACWYHTNDAPYTNTSINCSATPETAITTAWGSYGLKTIMVYANDTIGNFNSVLYGLTVSNISTSLTTPANATWWATTTVPLSCNVAVDPSASINLSVYLDAALAHTYTATSTSISETYSATSLSQGNHTWYCTGGNLDTGNIDTTETREFYVDNVAPVITFTNATNLSSLSNDMKSRINISISDATSDPYCMFNSTQTTTLAEIPCNSIINLNWSSSGYKTIQIRANDSANNINWSTINLQAKQYQTTVNYSTGIIEGESAVFTLRMNTTPIPIGNIYANLFYNGDNETFDSRTIVDSYTSIITKTLNIPSGAGNITGKPVPFYWDIYAEGLTTNVTNQTVYSLSIDNCTTNTERIYNFSLYNENTRVMIPTGASTNLSATMEAVMYSLQDSTIRWVSNTTYSGVHNFSLCVNTGWLNTTITTGLDLDITYDGDGFYYERYNEQRSIISNSTVPKKVNLYLLPDTLTSYKTYKINVKDANLIVVDSAVVEIYRYIPGTDTTNLVEAPMTDDLGNAIGHLVLADAVYKIMIKRNGVTLGTFNKITTTETSTCNSIYSDCILNLQLTTGSSQFSSYDAYLGIYYNYSYNPSTRAITLQFSSADGTAKTVGLNVTTFYNSTSICDSSTIAVSDTLTCSIPSSVNGTIVSVTKVGNNILSTVLNKVTPRETFGDISSLRYLILALLIPTFLIMGSASAGLAVVFMFLGLVLIFASGLLSANGWTGGASAIIWIIVSLFILLLKIRKGGQQNG